MSFREKSAWITFLTVLAAAGVFVVYAAIQGRYGYGALHVFLACVVGMVVVQVVLHVIAAALNPADARSPKDERERLIELKSHRVGYYVLVVAVLAMFITGHLPLPFGAIDMIYHAFAAVTLSTLTIALTQIVLFRLDR
jgi:hypothetical protein